MRDMGSPPRMRGKVPISIFLRFLGGITPAYAGKRLKVACPLLPTRDHPRVCGEKLAFQRHNGRHQGSPPRMRGKAANYLVAPNSAGITPAYAGKRHIWNFNLR